jgi:hypothetical protein
VWRELKCEEIFRKGETVGIGRERRRSVGIEVDREVGMK